MLYIKYLIIIVILLLNQNTNAYADKIVYLNMEKIMKKSKAGKFIIEKINKSNETNLKKFSKIEEDLKKMEMLKCKEEKDRKYAEKISGDELDRMRLARLTRFN